MKTKIDHISNSEQRTMYSIIQRICRWTPFLSSSQWRLSHFEDGLSWYNTAGEAVHLYDKPDGWRCRIETAEGEYNPSVQCPLHASFDTALACSFLWMKAGRTPGISMDGHPQVPVWNDEVISAVTPGCEMLYLDDPGDIERLFDLLEVQDRVQHLRSEVVSRTSQVGPSNDSERGDDP